MSDLTARARELLAEVGDDSLLLHLVAADNLLALVADLTAALERVEKLADEWEAQAESYGYRIPSPHRAALREALEGNE